MSFMTREEFLKMQSEREERAAARATNQRSNVGFFKLDDDGDEAIVRFAYSDPSQFDVCTVHPVNNVGGRKFGNYNCINDYKAGVSNCPLCAAGAPLRSRFFIKLVEYVQNEETGEVTPMAKTWDRPTAYMQTLANLCTEYGDISEQLFKIRRKGAKGSTDTTYDIMIVFPSAKYTEDRYPKDFSAFENFTVLGGPVIDKTYDELVEIASEYTEKNPDVQPRAQYTRPSSQATEKPAAEVQPGPRRVVNY